MSLSLYIYIYIYNPSAISINYSVYIYIYICEVLPFLRSVFSRPSLFLPLYTYIYIYIYTYIYDKEYIYIYIYIHIYVCVSFLHEELDCLCSVFEECLGFFWDEIKKKKQSRELWWELYGDLLPVFNDKHAQFAELCSQTSDWSAHAEKLRTCIASGSLGKKLFSGLQQYVCGAQVSKQCKTTFNEWREAGAEVTSVQFEEAIARISSAVSNTASELTDGLKRLVELQCGNLKFVVAVSSFQEDAFLFYILEANLLNSF